MKGIGSHTKTFSEADVGRVMGSLAADLWMIVQSAGLSAEWPQSEIDLIVSDIKAYACAEYVENVKVVLWNEAGRMVRARKYEVSTKAGRWSNDRPGDNLWPSTPNGFLKLVVRFGLAWDCLTDSKRKAFRASKGIVGVWDRKSGDTPIVMMDGTADRRYASNRYGLQRVTYAPAPNRWGDLPGGRLRCSR